MPDSQLPPAVAPRPAASVAPALGGSAGSRLVAIDIIRGFCIASMVFGHLAGGTRASWALHIIPEFSGALGFVLLSGFVLGVVQRRRLATTGLRAVEIKTLRRAGLILFAQYVLIAIGIATALLSPIEHAGIPPLDDLSPVDAVMRAATLSLAPPAGSVLRLYVVLLLLAVGAYWLLARGRVLTLVAASVALYGLGWVFPGATSFLGMNGGAGANWAAWQLLFFSALLVGWRWNSHRLAERVQRFAWPLAAIALAVLVAALLLGDRLPLLFDKRMAAPGMLLVAWSTVVILYLALTVVLRFVPRWVFRPLEVVGTRSLDSYIIQAAIAVIVPAVAVYGSDSWAALTVAVTAYLICWAWAEFRRSSIWPPAVRRRDAARAADPVVASAADAG